MPESASSPWSTSPRFRHHGLLLVAVIGGLFYILGQYIASQPQRIQQETEAKREISVQGRGEVNARPDIAHLTLGVQTGPQPTAKAALDILSQRFTAVVQAVKGLKVKEEDITTRNLSLNPVYDYSNGRQVLRGFEASESIEVKIRDLDAIGQIVSAATAQGVNQVGNISFEVDNPEEVQSQAQEKAINDAQAKAKVLSKALGVSLGDVKAFVAADSPTPIPPFYNARASLQTDALQAPVPVPSGTQDIVVTVTITYSLR